MTVYGMPLGMIEANCYIVADEDTKLCAVIDPGDESNCVMDYLERNKLTCRYILLTHGHFDHTMAANAVAEQTGATVCMSKLDANPDISGPQYRFTPPAGTIWLNDGDELTVGGLTFRVMATPGHSPGSLSFVCQDCIFTGDTLFRDSCGRTDLPGGDMKQLLHSLKRICDLPGNMEVYPGHMDATSLDRERRFNYYVKYAYEVLGQ